MTMDMVWCARTRSWATWCDTHSVCALCKRKMTCEVFILTLPVDYNNSPSTVKRNQLQQKKMKWPLNNFIMSSTNSNQTCPTKNRLRKSVISCIAVELLVRSKIWSKSHKRVLAWLIRCEISLSFCILLCQFVHLFALLLGPANCESRIATDLHSEKKIVNTFVKFTLRVNSLAASLPRVPVYMILFLFFSFAVSSTMATPCLDHVVRYRESIEP